MIVLLAFTGLLLGSLVHFYRLLCQKRARFDGLPTPPRKYWWLGNIDVIIKASMLFPDDSHPQIFFNYIKQKYNMPTVFYMDLWPISGSSMIFCDDPVFSAKYATTGTSLPKARSASDYLDEFLGPDNLVTAEGAHWKSLRGIFNPGFSAAHLMTLVPYMVDSSMTFLDILSQKAQSNELFQLEEYATRLTIDIIGKVVLNADFDSQRHDHPLVTTFRERTPLMFDATNPIQALKNFEFIRIWKLNQNGKKLDGLVGQEIDRAIAKRNQSGAPIGEKVAFKDRKRSIVDLALDAYYSDKMFNSAGSVKPSAAMDAAFRGEAITSVKTFLFAGHDTTSSTIAYALYLLHHHPTVHARLLDELRSTFGSLGATHIAATIKADPHTVNSLAYTNAILKETLRIFPPASTLRSSPSILPGATPKRNISSPTQTTHATAIASKSFVPERWFKERTPYPEAQLFSESGKEAFAPFSKGPRNCIGEQLSMLESKIILALVVGGGFDFVAELEGGRIAECAVGGVDGEKLRQQKSWAEKLEERKNIGAEGMAIIEGAGLGTTQAKDYIKPSDLARMKKLRGRTVEGYGIYQCIRGSAKPAYGMPGRIYLKELS
ncbi:putative sterigmatocystin biosynthesis monooxygenase stcS [Cyphellophora attinorum]|uniref:Putative sterigmatocystin biosynthesis monooxygenase stcS n=1 Tax=Cyphellophora attinorum TaxID=1664694 RepID=A0A0N0NNH7_9EURO|nr:putative sterigmatocystin biosynthesis monooxygenase stcS [Phialophora attinorum]KPI41389.1 putative sterigmatocystin biosynthesis monooxygenase stcS [Phialophora attinorum]